MAGSAFPISCQDWLVAVRRPLANHCSAGRMARNKKIKTKPWRNLQICVCMTTRRRCLVSSCGVEGYFMTQLQVEQHLYSKAAITKHLNFCLDKAAFENLPYRFRYLECLVHHFARAIRSVSMLSKKVGLSWRDFSAPCNAIRVCSPCSVEKFSVSVAQSSASSKRCPTKAVT